MANAPQFRNIRSVGGWSDTDRDVNSFNVRVVGKQPGFDIFRNTEDYGAVIEEVWALSVTRFRPWASSVKHGEIGRTEVVLSDSVLEKAGPLGIYASRSANGVNLASTERQRLRPETRAGAPARSARLGANH